MIDLLSTTDGAPNIGRSWKPHPHDGGVAPGAIWPIPSKNKSVLGAALRLKEPGLVWIEEQKKKEKEKERR